MAGSFRSLPSVNDLLNSPPLKGLLEKVGDVQVVAGVRGLIDRVRNELQVAVGNLTAGAPVTMARRYLFGEDALHNMGQHPTLNLTGEFFPEGLSAWMMPPAVLATLSQSATGYWTQHPAGAPAGEVDIQCLANKRLAHYARTDSAWMTASFPLALQVAWQGLVASGTSEALLAASDAVELRGKVRLIENARAAGVRIDVVGASNATTLADFEAGLAANPRISTIIVVATTKQSAVNPSLIQLSQLAKSKGKSLVVIAPHPALVDLSSWGLGDAPPLSTFAETPIDLLIAAGDRWMGGPDVGLLLGTKKMVGELSKTPLGQASAASSLYAYWMAAVLENADSLDRAEQEIPLLTLLSTSVANLDGRARRLLPQILATGQVSSGEVLSSTSEVGAAFPSIPSVTLALVPHNQSAEQLASKLAVCTPAVLVKVEAGRLLLNLRTLGAHQDPLLIHALESLPTILTA